jgi:hypothetical protein
LQGSMVSVIVAKAGAGLTVTVTMNAVPGHPPADAVTLYIAVSAFVVVLVSAPVSVL